LVAATTGVPSPDQVERMNNLRAEFEEIKSVEDKTGEALRIAEVFTQHASEMREMTDRWETSATSLDKFNLRKAKIDREFETGEIEKEERDRWYASNTTTVYDSKYWAERKMTVEKLNSLAEAMSVITGFQKENTLKGNYERMEAIVKKYRDYNSFIDGNKLTDEERATILAIEEEIEEAKQSMKRMHSNFLGAEFEEVFNASEEERNKLAIERQNLRRDDPTNSPVTRQRIKEIAARQKVLRESEDKLAARLLKERGVSDADAKAYQALYEEYRSTVKQLSALTESSETTYYYDTFQKELNKFVASKSQAERDAKIAKTKTFRIGKQKYEKVDTEFFEALFDGTMGEEMPAYAVLDHLFRKEFENSEWYQKNHFLSERYDTNAQGTVSKMIPIYAWRSSQPSDKRWIKEHAPNISWKRRVIKQEYKNENYETSLDGLPKIKAGKHQNADYQALRANNPALWEFRDFMMDKYLESQTLYPIGKGMGYKVPTIERDASGYSNIQRGFRGYGKQLKRKFALNAQDQDEGLFAYSDETGHERKFIPIKFSGRLEADLVSRKW